MSALASRQERPGQFRRFVKVDPERGIVTYHMVDSAEVARCLPVREWMLADPRCRGSIAAALRLERQGMRAERREFPEAAHA